jgi:hypothetical protein
MTYNFYFYFFKNLFIYLFFFFFFFWVLGRGHSHPLSPMNPSLCDMILLIFFLTIIDPPIV